MTEFAVLGGGASGLAGAISLGREAERTGLPAHITVYEKLPEPGKKILATGNGRCNLSCQDIDISRYNGDSGLLRHVLDHFTTEDCLDFFHSLGLLIREEDGRLYPYSLNAASVRNVLLSECQRLGVTVRTDYAVSSIARENGEFILNGSEYADMVLFALGGKAAAAHGTDGDGYRILKSLGIRYAPIFPALVQLKTGQDRDLKAVKRMKGTRARAAITLHRADGHPIGLESGEILFTDYGLSGIAAMQLSGDTAVLLRTEHPYLTIDFCPDLPDTVLLSYLRDCSGMRSNCPAGELLVGLLNRKISHEILLRAEISKEAAVSTLRTQQLARIAEEIKAFRLNITGTRGFKDAQVTRGGVPEEELREHSLESFRVPGLFFSGEILNADGICGGYNLHFAWGSGILAGKEMAERAALKGEGRSC